MARPVRPGLTQGASGGRGSGRRFAYFQGVWDELRKVVWPTRDELWRMTGVVVATVIIFSALIGGADFGLSYAVKPIYGLSNTTTTTTTTPTPGATTTATPAPSAAASPSSSASASSGAAASASASS